MKLNVNLPNHPYDIIIEKGILLLSLIIMWQVYMPKQSNVV